MDKYIQRSINIYFRKLCSKEIYRNDEEVIIGKAKKVIEILKQNSEYVNNNKNDFDEDEIKFITDETNELIEKIQNTYKNKNNVIKIEIHPMSGFYMLCEQEELLEELKEYYDELEEE